MRLALDAMGGDYAPANTVAGLVEALGAYKDFTVTLVGDEARVRAELAKHDTEAFESRISLHHASQVVDMVDNAVDSVRRKKDSSISRAIDLVKEGKADAVVSAGHTGALVAAATIKLRTLPGIERPGLAVLMPTKGGVWVLIDAGANIDPDPSHIAGYAVMGSIYASVVLNCQKPRVALLSIGSEETKGNEFSKKCFAVLKEQPGINFVGNTEGHKLFAEPVEVVVCDGFIGNIVLKTTEGLSKTIFAWVKEEMKASPIRLFGALLAKGAFLAIKNKTSTDEYGGTPLLGVNGVCIKAHGHSSARAIRNAIRAAREFVAQKVNDRIVETVRK